jgi:hypothetical protein
MDSSKIKGKLNYTSFGWEVLDNSFNPLYIPEATHYQLCYYIASLGVSFNLI